MLIAMFPLLARGGPVDPLLILLAALAIDAVIGDPAFLWRRIPHPVVMIGRAISFFDLKLNRPQRRDLVLRGLVTALLMAGLALAIGWAETELRRRWQWGWCVEIILTWTLLAQKSLFQHVLAVARGLDLGGLQAGRWAVSRIVGRDPDSLDAHGVARAAIETTAENFADGVVAPVFWFLLLGFPGLLLYKTVNTLDSMIGHLNARYRDFGMVSARLDDVMNFLPARIAALLICLAMAFAPGGRPLKAFLVMLRDHGHHRSPNSGWPEGAMAGGLELALAGPRRYGGEQVNEPWIGDGRARASATDIRRALYVFCVACLLNAGGVIAILWGEHLS